MDEQNDMPLLPKKLKKSRIVAIILSIIGVFLIQADLWASIEGAFLIVIPPFIKTITSVIIICLGCYHIVRLVYEKIENSILKKFNSEIEQVKRQIEKDKNDIEQKTRKITEKELFYNRSLLYKPIIENCESFYISMSDNNLETFADKMIRTFSQQPHYWSNIIVNSKPLQSCDKTIWNLLLSESAIEYAIAMADVRLGKFGDAYLPSNFYIYARCVGKILNSIKKFVAQNKNRYHINIYTLLTPPITKWFNLIYIADGNFWCTQNWWEEYKAISTQFKKNKDRVNIARLIGVNKNKLKADDCFEDPRNLYVRNGGNEVRKWILDLEEIFKLNNLPGIDLIEGIIPSISKNELQNVLDMNEVLSYAIGIASSESQLSKENEWKNLIEVIQNYYHDGTETNFDFSSSGVFYHYIDLEKVRQKIYTYFDYDDLFLIEIDDTF